MTTYKTQPGEVLTVIPPVGETLSGSIASSSAVITTSLTVAPPTPTPTPTPLPVVAGALDMGIHFASLPMTGPAYDRVAALARSTGQLDQSNIDCPATNILLANAGLFRRTGLLSYHDKVIAMLKADKPFSKAAHEPALQLGRNIAPRAIAAAWVGYEDASYKSYLAGLRTADTAAGGSKGDMIKTHEGRANNFGTCSGMSRIAIDLYIGDGADLAQAIKVHRAWTGEPSSFVFPSSAFGDLSWQSDKAHPHGINPRNALISGHDVDGVLPDDQRRGGAFTWPPFHENYMDQALGEAIVTTALIGVLSYGDFAVRRAYQWLDRQNFAAVGDDRWQARMADALFGTGTAQPVSGTQDGKSFGLTDWLY